MTELSVLFIPCYVDGLPYTSASVRFRALWPAKYWPEADVYPTMSRPFGEYDAYVFQKAYLSRQSRRMMQAMRQKGKLLALDLCDADWLQSAKHEQRLLAALPLMDMAVCPTSAIHEYLRCWVPAAIIPDRLDLDCFQRQHEHSAAISLSLIWFGYSHNLSELDAIWPELLPILDAHDARLTILSDRMPPEWAERRWAEVHRARFVQWTEHGANDEIARHDIALVPQRSPFKSNNRATTASALGVVPAMDAAQVSELVSAKARRQVATHLRQVVKRDYDVRISVACWKLLLADQDEHRRNRPHWASVQKRKGN